MAKTVLIPPIPQFSDVNGNPLPGGQLFSYTAGTSALKAVYTDVALTIPWSNPLILNAAGEPSGPIYLATDTAYKFILKDLNGVTRWTADNQPAASAS